MKTYPILRYKSYLGTVKLRADCIGGIGLLSLSLQLHKVKYPNINAF